MVWDSGSVCPCLWVPLKTSTIFLNDHKKIVIFSGWWLIDQINQAEPAEAHTDSR
jgi:hypothetical protein